MRTSVLVVIVLSKFRILTVLRVISTNVAIGSILGHLDPVTRPHHVVRDQLYAGDESQDSVFEDQQQDGSKRADTAQKHPG